MACASVNCFVLLLLLSSCKGVSRHSIEKSYKKGLQAYSDERWSECIVQFEETLHLYKLYKSVFNNCGAKCKSQEVKSKIDKHFSDLKMYESFLNERHCLINCRDREFDAVHLQEGLEESILFNIEERKPYEYLHICYFQMNAVAKAASAAYTFLLAHPDDTVMNSNLKYYTAQPEVNPNELVDLESEDYEVLHKLGKESYNQKKWGETIVAMEEVLTDYFAWEKGCRVSCEHQPEQEESPDFVITVSNNILFLLQCRQQCQSKLSILGYTSGIEFIADILNYLQISYYHSNRFEDAAKIVASYLALLPDDEDMLRNKEIYSSLVDEKAFTERSDIVYYFKYDQYEKELLSYFYNTNTFDMKSNSVKS